MKTSERMLAYCRSPRGQMSLIAAAYGGAVVAACIVLALRSTWFAGTVYERFPTERQQPGARELRELAGDIAAGRKGAERLEDLSAEQLIVVYGVLIDDETHEPDGRLARGVADVRGEELLVRLRRTLAVGNQRQRLRALRILGTMRGADSGSEAADLGRFALERARQCGDAAVAAEAQSLLAELDRR